MSRRFYILVGFLTAVLLGEVVLWLTLPDVVPLKTSNPATTNMIELRRKQATEAGKAFKLKWEWRPLGRISPLLQRAVIFAEDPTFFKHEGVDWVEIKEAAEYDWREKSFARGASTITQQVAKNLFLSPSRNPIRKLREFAIARRLDAELGKSRVLEIYLNIAEWGDGIFGAEAAARHWFGCSASQLDAEQAARLAVALPNPFKRSPVMQSSKLARKAARLVRALVRAGLVERPPPPPPPEPEPSQPEPADTDDEEE